LRGESLARQRPFDAKKEAAMAARIMILNGPNLNFLGIREPHIYGSTTLKEIEASCQELARELGISISFHQSNLEGELVNLIQSAHGNADAIIKNPAAYSFTSIALIDVLKIFEGPKIEVHISNIHARDELHRHSITSSASTAVICGLGPLRIHRRYFVCRATAREAAGYGAGVVERHRGEQQSIDESSGRR
jgi:3-dehydroquinate dehydratase II